MFQIVTREDQISSTILQIKQIKMQLNNKLYPGLLPYFIKGMIIFMHIYT